jgi:hypothetical protein
MAATVEWYLANQDWCARAGDQYRQERLGLAAESR